MSKHNLFNQPGLERVFPDTELPVAAKITGRNLSAVSLLVAQRAEHGETRVSLGAFFSENGSLDHITLVDKTGSIDVPAGHYLVLDEDQKNVLVVTPEAYADGKKFVNDLGDLGSLITSLLTGVPA